MTDLGIPGSFPNCQRCDFGFDARLFTVYSENQFVDSCSKWDASKPEEIFTQALVPFPWLFPGRNDRCRSNLKRMELSAKPSKLKAQFWSHMIFQENPVFPRKFRSGRNKKSVHLHSIRNFRHQFKSKWLTTLESENHHCPNVK